MARKALCHRALSLLARLRKVWQGRLADGSLGMGCREISLALNRRKVARSASIPRKALCYRALTLPASFRKLPQGGLADGSLGAGPKNLFALNRRKVARSAPMGRKGLCYQALPLQARLRKLSQGYRGRSLSLFSKSSGESKGTGASSSLATRRR